MNREDIEVRSTKLAGWLTGWLIISIGRMCMFKRAETSRQSAVGACACSLVQPCTHNHAGDGVGPVGSALCRLDVIIHYAARRVVMRPSFFISLSLLLD